MNRTAVTVAAILLLGAVGCEPHEPSRNPATEAAVPEGLPSARPWIDPTPTISCISSR